MRCLAFAVLIAALPPAFAQEEEMSPVAVADPADLGDATTLAEPAESADAAEYTPTEVDRDPAALTIQPRKRTYAGGADEEDLRVLPALAGAEIKVDARSLQREVYKSVYNQELKEERHDDAEE